MYDTTHILEHHGVKGQKWGVRRYRQARSEALSYASKQKSESKLAKKYSKQAKKKNADKSVRNEAERHSKKASVFGERYDKKVQEAAQLPIKIKPHRAAKIAKIVGRDYLHLQVAGVVGGTTAAAVTLLTKNPNLGKAVGSAALLTTAAKYNYVKKTDNDKFAEGVRNTQRKQKR